MLPGTTQGLTLTQGLREANGEKVLKMPSLASKLQLLKTDNVAQKRKAGPTICHKLTPKRHMCTEKKWVPSSYHLPFKDLKTFKEDLKNSPRTL